MTSSAVTLAGAGPADGMEDWMLAFASMTVEVSPPTQPLPSSKGEGFPTLSFVTRRLSAESISRSGMDSPVLPANDE
jgi:hypothetical protein